MTHTTEEIAFCSNLFKHLADGGVWGVPRSGLIFTHKGKTLTLTARIEGFPAQDQADDLSTITAKFRVAGITVTDNTQKP